MSGLFRSEDMTYVRLLMTDEAAYDTIRELGVFGKLHVVDLSENRHDGGNVGASESFTYYKKRVANCVYWERKLLSFRELFTQFGIPAIPHDIQVRDLRYGDILEALREYIDPQEEQITKNVVFKKQQTTQIAELTERLKVLEYVHRFQMTTVRSPLPASPVYGTFNDSDNSGSINNNQDEKESFHAQLQLQETGRAYQQRRRSGGSLNLGGGVGDDDDSFHSVVCGIVSNDKVGLLERMLFRVSRGNCVVRSVPVEEKLLDPVTGEYTNKSVFSILLLGEQLKKRIERILGHFGATEYAVPSNVHEYHQLQKMLGDRILEMRTVMERSDEAVSAMLYSIAFDKEEPGIRSPWMDWYMAVLKEKAICDILKKCDSEGPQSKMIRCEGWLPSQHIDELRVALHNAVRSTQQKQAVLQIIAKPSSSPPTFFNTNKFTGSFQAIVDTYGVPRYKEVNPGLFTIISFPFLFGIMYGDIGHATAITLFAVYMIFNEKKFDLQIKQKTIGELFSMAYAGRYLLLMMGLFGIYAGTIYNDCMSVPFATFGSQWVFENGTDIATPKYSQVNWGFDHHWYYAKNELAFFNSFKMKLSVTLGVVQMAFGCVLSLLNHMYFKDSLHIFFEFIPRIVFLLSIFGYMIFMVIFKLCVDWTGRESKAPSLIQTMISMFLSIGHVDDDKRLYTGQETIQVILVLLAVGSVPFMLFPIPIITNRLHKKIFGHRLDSGNGLEMNLTSPLLAENSRREREREDEEDFRIGVDDEKDSESKRSLNSAGSQSQLQSDPASPPPQQSSSAAASTPVVVGAPASAAASSPSEHHEGGGGHGPNPYDPNYSFGDHMITQAIHTIEFVLGCVSNTASYLRLWALSLAHAELANVFWDKMIMQYGIESDTFIITFVGMAVWAGATFAVLLCMDVLECFLHALRLHWVEFQNKFFNADGYAFVPFEFATLIEQESK